MRIPFIYGRGPSRVPGLTILTPIASGYRVKKSDESWERVFEWGPNGRIGRVRRRASSMVGAAVCRPATPTRLSGTRSTPVESFGWAMVESVDTYQPKINTY